MNSERYEIVGRYGGAMEVIDTAETLQEAKELRTEYALAFGFDWVISIRDTRLGEPT